VKLFLASDHAGVKLRSRLVEWLRGQGHQAVDLGPQSEASADYPDWSARLGRAVRAETGARGVLVCGSGIGVSIAANKLRGIRAAAPCSVEAAGLARAHNDANVLCLGARFCAPALAEAMLTAWLSATPEGHRHTRRIAKVSALESAESHAAVVEAEGARLERRQVVARLWAGDPTAVRRDGVHDPAAFRDRSGWMRGLDTLRAQVEGGLLRTAVEDIRGAGFRHAVLLGGSPAAQAVNGVFGAAAGVDLFALPGYDPAEIAAVESAVDLARTVFLVGPDGERLESYFRARTGGRPQFVLLAGPEEQPASGRYRTTLRSPGVHLGGATALSWWDLLPAALLGVDAGTLLARARRMATACREPVAANPGAQLGAALAATARVGRDKLTVVTSPELTSLGGWLAQVMAATTPVVPVVDEPVGPAEVYGPDRAFVSLKLAGGAAALDEDAVVALRGAGHPVIEMVLGDRYDLAAEWVRWQMAGAVAGAALGLDTTPPAGAPAASTDEPRACAADDRKAITAHLATLADGDHLALAVFFRRTDRCHQLIGGLRVAARARTGAATTASCGPSLRLADDAGGVFLQLVGGDRSVDRTCPGESTGFRALLDRQARIEWQTLQARGRRVLRVDVGADIERGLERLIQTVAGEPT
jgi:RpiB/LacA/LacB family sugar-phosphate isomerase